MYDNPFLTEANKFLHIDYMGKTQLIKKCVSNRSLCPV